ncbi:Hypothetical protein AT6N2_L1129 [Agrobacterium tumefaciens]|nr:Hypothetical protein AT6N2_L1129 [Agrobacterium tumefaciens]
MPTDFRFHLFARITGALHGLLDRVLRDAFFLRLVADFMILSGCDLGPILSSASRCGCHRRSPYGFGHRKTDTDSRSSILFVTRDPQTSAAGSRWAPAGAATASGLS